MAPIGGTADAASTVGDGGAMTGKFPDRPVIADPLGADALDFWLGSWAVSWAGGGHGSNTIRRILDERAIEESFHGSDAESTLKGRSLSVRDAADGRWRQTWVDSTGAYLDFAGVAVDGRISFQREATFGGVAVVQRMVWLDVMTDAFRWQWQRSADGGASWDVVWEIDYRRA
jgi:hypothetical protein